MTLHATGTSTDVALVRVLVDEKAASTSSRLCVMTPGASSPADGPAHGTCATEADTLDIGAFELVRKFVEHLIAEQAASAGRDGSSARLEFDWDALTTSVADSISLEIAIGRAVAAADRLVRERSSECIVVEADPSSTIEAPFFAFTQDDAVPDFGDDRYRSRFARRVANIIGVRPTSVTHV